MAVAPEHANGAVRFLGTDESHRFFDAQARRLLNMSGEEFLRKLDSGAFSGALDDRTQRAVLKLKMLRSFGR